MILFGPRSATAPFRVLGQFSTCTYIQYDIVYPVKINNNLLHVELGAEYLHRLRSISPTVVVFFFFFLFSNLRSG